MKNRFGVRILGLAILLGSMATLKLAKADDWNKETTVTLGVPVAVPGQVLQPGKYIFELEDSQVDRNVVQIFNADKTHLIDTFLAIPAVRTEPTSDSVIKLQEREAGSPEAIGTWFFAGEDSGVTFLYPGD